MRVDVVDEKSAREEMGRLKMQLREEVAKHWLKTDWEGKFRDVDEKVFDAKKYPGVFMRAWREGRKNWDAYLKKGEDQEPKQSTYHWRGEELKSWTRIDEAKVGGEGSFSVAAGGKSLLRGIAPAGVSSHALSEKDRGVLISPEMELTGGEELWMRVAGNGSAMARYAVQNYPRSGTVFPVTELKDGKWKWVRQNLDYWKGDRIHVEVSTAQEQPVLSKKSERSWFGVSEVVVAKKGEFVPGQVELGRVKAMLRAAYREGDEGGKLLARVLREAVENWRRGKITDSEAMVLGELLEVGFLPNDESLGSDLLKKYRDLEKSLAVPVRAPGVWEANARDQEFYERGGSPQAEASGAAEVSRSDR